MKLTWEVVVLAGALICFILAIPPFPRITFSLIALGLALVTLVVLLNTAGVH